MTRKKRIEEFIRKECQKAFHDGIEVGVSAQMVSDALGIYRTDASAILNGLWRQGLLEKIGKRPVKYLPKGLGDSFVMEEARASSGSSENGPGCLGQNVETSQEANMGHNACVDNTNRPSVDKAFEAIVGSNGSLRAQIQLAKAAVSYPPIGLHTLIVGETGVGKSLLAEAMWRYACDMGSLGTAKDRKIPFVVFNCADYAHNPQLLVSQLFGHAKGAFTGAHDNKEGLVDKAQNGILFLDEIHRLPPEGQEILFMLMDRGVYRRLGETSERKSQLMIIGATSEPLESALLAAFRRRIPVQIGIPKLIDRPLGERLELVIRFISEESSRLGLPIWFSGKALRMFMSYECPGNIGDLKNDLQLSCAKSYLSHLASEIKGNREGSRVGAADIDGAGVRGHGWDHSGKPVLRIDIDDIPQRVYVTSQEVDFSTYGFDELFSKGLMIEPGQKAILQTLSDDYRLPVDLYEFVERRLHAYETQSLSEDEIETKVGDDLERYFYATIWALHGDQHDNMRSGIIVPSIWNLASFIISEAAYKLHRNYSRTVQAALALHLQQFVSRAKAGQVIYNPRLKNIQEQYGREFSMVKELIPEISHSLGLSVPDDEAGFLAMFLARPVEKEGKPRIGLLVACHGKSTAASMADVANSLLGTNHIKAVDAPLQRNLSEIFDDLAIAIKKCDSGKGVLVLADMGSFLSMEEDLRKRAGVRCRVIPNVTTVMVLEACKAVMTSDADLDEIACDIRKELEALYQSAFAEAEKDQIKEAGITDSDSSALESNPNNPAKGVIVTVCPTGAGTAQKIREILLEKVAVARTLDIFPMSALQDLVGVREKFGKRLKLVVGSIDPGFVGVPFVPVDQVLTTDGLRKIDVLLTGRMSESQIPKFPEEKYSREEAIGLMQSQIGKFVTNLPGAEVDLWCKRIINAIEKDFYQCEAPIDLLVRVYLHAACMFDRLAGKEPLLLPEWASRLKEERQPEFQVLERILSLASRESGMEIPESEIYYFLVTLPARHQDT